MRIWNGVGGLRSKRSGTTCSTMPAGMQGQSARTAAVAAVAFCASCAAARGRHLHSMGDLQQNAAQADQSTVNSPNSSIPNESDNEDSVDTTTVVLAVVAAALIAALVICGFYKMCRSGTAAERAAHLFKFDKSGRGDSDRGSYVRHSDSAAQVSKPANVHGSVGLQTIPSGSTL